MENQLWDEISYDLFCVPGQSIELHAEVNDKSSSSRCGVGTGVQKDGSSNKNKKSFRRRLKTFLLCCRKKSQLQRTLTPHSRKKNLIVEVRDKRTLPVPAQERDDSSFVFPFLNSPQSSDVQRRNDQPLEMERQQITLNSSQDQKSLYST